MTKAALDRWTRDYMRNLDRRIQQRKFDHGLAEFLKGCADLRRSKERVSVTSKERAYEQHKSMQRLTGRPVPIRVVLDKFRILSADVVLPRDEADVTRWRTHVAGLARQHGIAVEYCVIAQQNGYAFAAAGSTRARIEVPAITNVAAYACVLHEIGHCLNRCQKDHRTVKSSDGRRTFCVRCELQAWAWAIAHAEPHWTRAMHRELAESLPSYRKDATASEQAEIDRMCDGRTYFDARIARLREDV